MTNTEKRTQDRERLDRIAYRINAIEKTIKENEEYVIVVPSPQIAAINREQAKISNIRKDIAENEVFSTALAKIGSHIIANQLQDEIVALKKEITRREEILESLGCLVTEKIDYDYELESSYYSYDYYRKLYEIDYEL
jgi:DNA-binding FrmR family transcriptional regulator